MTDYEYGEPDPDYGVSYESSEPRVISKKRSTEKEDEISRNFNRAMIDLYNART